MDQYDLYHDKLGIIHALAVHLAIGQETDEVSDERVFKGMINPIVAKMEMVIDENFGGDSNAFHIRLLEVIATATFEGDNPVIAIDNWLNVEWEASGRLYN
jgi:hypothetical protein